MFSDLELNINDCNILAYGCGPGASFTGLRIAASIIQGISYGLGIKCVSISSLHSIAQAAYDDFGLQECYVLLKALGKKYYFGHYMVNQGIMMPVVMDRIIVVHDISQFCNKKVTIITHSVAEIENIIKLEGLYGNLKVLKDKLIYPSAKKMIKIIDSFDDLSDLYVSISDVIPNYLLQASVTLPVAKK